ncbi:glutathione S-transferase [Boseongicola aestuarii]|uniref:Putative GST-like protein YibF n=1 Tax=Boseongicola aestuarii TaxID=1470561 RepID=A0A238IZE3_9RHOB|nr:glutathione S-transferase [Boseongicola aestuarii]SMX23120.1 putative GST-like protein YibF [Boseongicola aestuarii]
MKLMHSSTSPYVRKVEVLLRESGLIDQVPFVPGSGTPLAPNDETIHVNPLGKVPALLRDDGPAIYDSRVICRYLDDISGGHFYPKTRLYEVLTLEALGEGIIDAALLMAYEWRLRPEEKRFDEWVEGQWSKIARALDVLDDRWMSHLQGNVTMGQISVACSLGYLDLRNADRNWRDGHTSLATWYETFAKRDSMLATVPA